LALVRRRWPDRSWRGGRRPRLRFDADRIAQGACWELYGRCLQPHASYRPQAGLALADIGWLRSFGLCSACLALVRHAKHFGCVVVHSLVNGCCNRVGRSTDMSKTFGVRSIFGVRSSVLPSRSSSLCRQSARTRFKSPFRSCLPSLAAMDGIAPALLDWPN
jgi:hypothetical protein